MVDLAKKYELQVMINTIVEGAPYWLYEKYPNCLYETVKGEKITQGGPANIPTAGWPGLCMDNPEIRGRVCRFIEETAAHYRKAEHVVIIDVWNEPHLEPMYDYPDELLCACEGSKEEFRKWLKEQYQTLDRLNEVWYRRYSDWNQVVPPPRFGTYPDMMDWRRFWLYNLRRWLDEKVAAARRGAPDKLIQTHSASACYMGAVGNGALGTELADEFLLAEPVDLFGLSSFPIWLMGNTKEEYFLSHMLNLDIICAASRGKTFYQVELQGGPGKPGVLGHTTPDRQDVRVWNWNVIAAGGKGAVYWQYAYEPAGIESPGFGLTGLNHENTERSIEAGRCARYFQEQEIDGTTPVLSVNGICISRNADLFLFAAERQEKMYADSLSGIYQACMDAGIPVRFIHTSFLKYAWEEGLKVLYIPMAMALSQEEQDDILTFAEKGGTVILEAACGFYDEHGELDVRTSILRRVFGSEKETISYKKEETIFYQKTESAPVEQIICKSASYVQTMDITRGRVLGTTKSGQTVYAEADYGKGTVRWIGVHPAMLAKRDKDVQSREFVKEQFIGNGYDNLQELGAAGLIVRMLQKEEEYRLVAVNWHADAKPLRVKFGGKVTETTVPAYDGVMISLNREEIE